MTPDEMLDAIVIWRWLKWWWVIPLMLIFCFGWMVAEGQGNDLFRRCSRNVNADPVNVIWNKQSYIESSRSNTLIQVLLNFSGEAVKWDSTIGAHYPDDADFGISSKTLGITLSDGTIISYIINSQTSDRYYGWLTYSTYRTSASYNSTPHPHVKCGFWSISKDDYNTFYELFNEEIIQYRSFKHWMR